MTSVDRVHVQKHLLHKHRTLRPLTQRWFCNTATISLSYLCKTEIGTIVLSEHSPTSLLNIPDSKRTKDAEKKWIQQWLESNFHRTQINETWKRPQLTVKALCSRKSVLFSCYLHHCWMIYIPRNNNLSLPLLFLNSKSGKATSGSDRINEKC